MKEVDPAILAAIDRRLSATDKAHLFENHYSIKDKDGNIRLMTPLRRAQRKALAVINYCRREKIPVRLLIGKSRKRGLSTLIEADMLDEVMCHGYDGIVIAHDKPTAEYIFNITRRFYDHLDLPKPGLYKGITSKNEMRFHGHEGHVVVETANNIQAGTGRTPQYIHASEAAKWEKGADTAVSLLQSIGDGPNTTLIFESTFFGEDSLFLPKWTQAWESSKLTFDEKLNVKFEVHDRDKWNGYIPLFISLLDDEDALRPFYSDSDRDRLASTIDPYEQGLIDRFDVPLEFLNWRRFTIKHKCNNSLDFFKQEYPITWEEAVRATGRPRFDLDKIDLWPLEDPRLGALVRSETWDRRISFRQDRGEPLRLWRTPQEGHRYVLGVDTSEGIVDEHNNRPDHSVIQVLDLDTGGEQVAAYYGRISEEHLVEPMLLIAEWYNWAYLIIETNSTGKHVGIEAAKRYPADRIYRRMDWERGKPKQSKVIGWRTHVGSRNVLIGKLATAIEQDAVRVHDENTRRECRRFQFCESGRVEAAPGEHDDHVFALGLAVIGMETYPANLISPEHRRQMQQSLNFQRTFRPGGGKDRTASPVTGY